MSNGVTQGQALDQFLIAPVTHLESHAHILQLIASEMGANHPEAALVREALDEMTRAVNLVHLASWQRSNVVTDTSWKDFVSKESVKDMSKKDLQRQMWVHLTGGLNWSHLVLPGVYST